MGKHVAIFDHAPSIVDLMKSVLTMRGFTVSTHDEDESGLQEVADTHPDLIILGNPYDPSQLKFLDALRAQPATASVPVLIASTAPYRFEADELRAQYGAILVIAKPFSVSVFLERVRAALAINSDAPTELE